MYLNRLLISLIASIMFIAQNVIASPKMGAGVVLGDVTGISSNYFYQSTKSIDSAIELDLDLDKIEISSVHLWYAPTKIVFNKIMLDWYYGAGLKFFHRENYHFEGKRHNNFTDLGPRATIGTKYNFDDQPIDIFAQINGTLYVVEDSDFDLSISIGSRYYF